MTRIMLAQLITVRGFMGAVGGHTAVTTQKHYGTAIVTPTHTTMQAPRVAHGIATTVWNRTGI